MGGAGVLQRQNGLLEQHQVVGEQAFADQARQGSVPFLFQALTLFRQKDFITVATIVFGQVAGHVGRFQDFLLMGEILGNGSDPDADPDGDMVTVTDEVIVVHAVKKFGGHFLGILDGTVFQKNAKLIPTYTGQAVPAAHMFGEHGTDASQHPVAGVVAAGVVDRFEIVQIEKEQGIQVIVLGPLNGPRQSVIELLAVDQVGQGIMTGLVNQDVVNPS